MKVDDQKIIPGVHVEEILYGYKGFVREVFANFWSIDPQYIYNKQEWLDRQIVPIDLEERTHRWVVIDTLEGDQVLAPEGRVEIRNELIITVKGIFLRNRNAHRDYMKERIAPLKDYTMAWLDDKKQWLILPKVHCN